MRDSTRDKDLKNRLLDSVGEGEGGMIWENSTETCTQWNITQLIKMAHLSQFYEMDETGVYYTD